MLLIFIRGKVGMQLRYNYETTDGLQASYRIVLAPV